MFVLKISGIQKYIIYIYIKQGDNTNPKFTWK